MDECVKTHPPRYQVGRAAVACYLYKDQPLATGNEPVMPVASGGVVARS
jgi:hypothetical protein